MTGREGDLVLVNGQSLLQLTAAPGTRERWRIINACVARSLRLRLDGQDLHLVGVDLPLGGQPQPTAEVLLAPGNRADLLVTTRAGTSTLQALPYNRGTVGMGMRMGGGMGSPGSATSSGSTVGLATLTVDGSPAEPVAAVATMPPVTDLRGTTVTDRRTLTLAMGMGMVSSGGMAFTIDGRTFGPNRIDQAVEAGAVEEWTITNTSPMDHPLPLARLADVGSVRGRRHHGYPDLAERRHVSAGSSSVVRIAFDTYTGRTVYHCHILDHEDNGMMGVIVVT